MSEHNERCGHGNFWGHCCRWIAGGNGVPYYKELEEKLALSEKCRASLEKDVNRYRWLRFTLHNSVGGGVEVNDQKLVYEEPTQGEQVRVYWYPDTPVGFCHSHGETLDAAIDAAMQAAP